MLGIGTRELDATSPELSFWEGRIQRVAGHVRDRLE